MKAIQDTHLVAEKVQNELFRGMSLPERISKAFGMSQIILDMAFRAIKKTHPLSIVSEIQARLAQHLHGISYQSDGENLDMAENNRLFKGGVKNWFPRIQNWNCSLTS